MAKLSNLIKSATDSLHTTYRKGRFVIVKHSPEILIAGGIIGTITAFGMAIAATRKLDDILEDGNKRIEDTKAPLHITYESPEAAAIVKKTVNKELAKEYGVTVLNVAKLYAPSGIVLGLSMTAILSSHNIMRKRNLSIAAAYTALDRAFDEYRQRVADRLGEETEKEICYGISSEKEEEAITDENGKKKKIKTEHKVFGDGEYGPYAKFFDEHSRCWEKDPELNLMFLRRTERYFNDILKRDGYVFLCDVYKELDIDETKASRSVGWIYKPESPEHISYIDFGLYKAEQKKARDFVNGYEPSILLDFNCDGIIINKVEYPG